MLYRLSYVGGAFGSILSAGYLSPRLATIYRVLDKARSRLKRLKPEQAAAEHAKPMAKEFQGPKGPEPTRYGDWENKGIASDF